MSSRSLVLSFSPRAVLSRRVLPLAVTLVLWSTLIDGLRLLAAAL